MMIALWVLLAINAGLSSLLLGSHGEFPFNSQGALLNIFGFTIVACLYIITYIRATYAWVLATAIAIFPLACGCITAVIAITMLTSLGRVKAANLAFPLTLDDWRCIGRRILGIVNAPEPEWHSAGKYRIRFFDNAALVLYVQAGWSITVSPNQARVCTLTLDRKGRPLLQGLPADKTVRVKKMRLTPEVADAWRTWVGHVASQ